MGWADEHECLSKETYRHNISTPVENRLWEQDMICSKQTSVVEYKINFGAILSQKISWW